VKKIRNLIMVDGAFSPQTDPGYNHCEEFRDSLANTGVILHVRIVGEPEEVLSRVKRLWKPGLKLIVGTHVQDPKAQHQLYHDIHRLCAET
jgi:alkanesulfonate monooxygenase SsuD/methylene tetrahydromethanopterin reductase-like flavin-dependent oxidoreductase (luciferase family)